MLKSILFGAVSWAVAATPDATDGNHRINLTKKTGHGFNKYSNIADRSLNFKPSKSLYQKVTEFVWGKDERTIRFESAVA
jgi:hypothetical protein